MTRGEESAQMGELVAMCRVIVREDDTKEPVYIYTNPYAVSKGCTNWLPFCEQNQRVINWVASMAVREIGRHPKLVKQKCFLVGWIPAHQKRDNPVHLLNNQADSLARVAGIAVKE